MEFLDSVVMTMLLQSSCHRINPHCLRATRERPFPLVLPPINAALAFRSIPGLNNCTQLLGAKAADSNGAVCNAVPIISS